MSEPIEVIATTVSGSIEDWGKVKRIVPLFESHGWSDVRLHVVDSHAEARAAAARVLATGSRIVISAGGSGTFRAVLEGCCDSAVPLDQLRLGFLRKGSADLIGKVLGMPDEIEPAIALFARAIRDGTTVPCDVLQASEDSGAEIPRHFVGYGGAEVFGRIPHYTENRFMKWYKGVLSQVFGDLGPFTTGMTLAILERLVRTAGRSRREWRVIIDGESATSGAFHALIVVNGYLGPDLPFSDESLGSGRFTIFGLRDLGAVRLLQQARRVRNGTIDDDPVRFGWETFSVDETLRLETAGRFASAPFPANVDGSTMVCRGALTIRRVDRIPLIGDPALSQSSSASS